VSGAARLVEPAYGVTITGKRRHVCKGHRTALCGLYLFGQGDHTLYLTETDERLPICRVCLAVMNSDARPMTRRKGL
jgi:hypothetical protein